MLITTNYVKSNFPNWSYYCSDEEKTPDQVIESEIQTASIQLSEYVTVTETTITEALKLHLFNIVRKRLFDRKHGDTEFQTKPAIVKEYEDSLKILEKYRTGEMSVTQPEAGQTNEKISFTAKPRKFGNWFTENL